MKIGDKIVCEDGIKFEIKEELDSGGQGNIYIVMKNSNSNDLYALKIINEENVNLRKKKIDNIRILHCKAPILKRKLDNRPYNIALPISIYNANNDFGYVMNLYPGKNIGKFMIEKRFDSMSLEDRLNLVYKISQPAHFLRTHGFCYQDFSHGNFLFDENTGVISVIDIDNVTANSNSEAGITNFVKGTMFYMPPEIAFGQCNPSIDSDNYALATLFFKIMTGSTNSPYHGKKFYSKPVTPGNMEEAAFLSIDEPDDFGIDWLTFVFDPVDRSNEIELNDPNPKFVAEGKKIINNWNFIPDTMKDYFYRAFRSPLDAEIRKKRPTATDWMWLLDGLVSNSSTDLQETANQKNNSTSVVYGLSSKLTIFVELPDGTKVTIDSEQKIENTRGIPLGIIKLEGNKYKFISTSIFKIRTKLGNEYIDLFKGDSIELKEKMEVYIVTSPSEKIMVISIK